MQILLVKFKSSKYTIFQISNSLNNENDTSNKNNNNSNNDNYVWIYENGTKELKSRPKRAFFSRQKLSKSGDISIKRKVNPFCLPLPVYPPFTAVLSPFFFPFTWLRGGLKV